MLRGPRRRLFGKALICPKRKPSIATASLRV
jgi:hypothetical protein